MSQILAVILLSSFDCTYWHDKFRKYLTLLLHVKNLFLLFHFIYSVLHQGKERKKKDILKVYGYMSQFVYYKKNPFYLTNFFTLKKNDHLLFKQLK